MTAIERHLVHDFDEHCEFCRADEPMNEDDDLFIGDADLLSEYEFGFGEWGEEREMDEPADSEPMYDTTTWADLARMESEFA